MLLFDWNDKGVGWMIDKELQPRQTWLKALIRKDEEIKTY